MNRCEHLSVNEKEVENVSSSRIGLYLICVQVFANLYFNRVINEEAECFEDFVDLLVASFAVHFSALKRECERYICRELMLVSFSLHQLNIQLFVLQESDDAFVKVSCLIYTND